MQNSAQAAGVVIGEPVTIAEPTDLPFGPEAQQIPEQEPIVVQPVAVHGPGITLADVLGLFNIFVGVMIVMALLLYFGGLITWAVRLGTIGRHEGIILMEWGCAVLFVTLILLAIVKYLVIHPSALSIVVSIVVGLFIIWIIFMVMRSGGGAEHEEH